MALTRVINEGIGLASAIAGEGTATTNLQQGLAKAWGRYSSQSTATLNDSFSVSSLTDNGTGNIRLTFTNAMDSANHSSPAISSAMNTVSQGAATTYVETITYSSSHSASDSARNMVATFGDLA